jgi:hypothetical protein
MRRIIVTVFDTVAMRSPSPPIGPATSGSSKATNGRETIPPASHARRTAISTSHHRQVAFAGDSST